MAKIIGIIDGAPFDIRTWSGSSKYLFRELQKRNALVNAYSAVPPNLLKRILQALVFSPNREKWQFKHHLDPRMKKHMSTVAQKHLQNTTQEFDTILQIGAWYNLVHPQYLNISYHDGNLAMRIANPFGYPHISQRYIDRALQFEKKLYQDMDIIFTMSNWLRQSFIDDFQVASNKIHAVGAGINLPEILDTTDKQYSEPVILMVAREFLRKGGKEVLRAFEIVRKKIPNARLRIIGPTLEQQLPEGVECLGYLSKNNPQELKHLLNAYLNATVFVMPSLYEPFGIPFLEAMAHRVPCIGSNICAMPEIIKDGETGFLVPPKHSDILAEKMVHLLDSPELCQQFGEAGYQRYQAEFTWARVAEKITDRVDYFLKEKTLH